MTTKKCSYCNATTAKGIIEAGWIAVQIDGKYTRRACPAHKEALHSWVAEQLQ